ncbi:alpha/beta fold hydrolase [Criblamydia sequanensis]|uniref:Alpha/beta hydrolase domain-containing protein n=1 Tax=Candidatus Criblamydia sequanensis CRIB-18 TaxID=1437425 RepID=A0A090CYP8_9BACT|nr:alpha/beta hydrolase [Criblamydia sequanensis]CDR33752.1 Alpha/beta hydrolase domain-containing protein [Criblamydia sequanensis CRIB-18]
MSWSKSLIASLFFCAFFSFAQAEFKPEVKMIEVDGVKIAYYIRGQGKPLFMINGFISTMSLWDPALLEELAKNYQLILFDNRGVGLSTDTIENKTTIPQMADDVAGLIKGLGYSKANILGWSMGARIGQQLLIRHPELVDKAVLCAANPGGKYQDRTAPDVENKLNNPNVSETEKIGLVFPDNEQGTQAAKESLARIKAAVKSGSIPNNFSVSKETLIRQNRARTVLWNNDNENFNALKDIKVPVLLSDGRFDIIDLPKNSLIIANQIPYSWTAFLNGGHAFLFQEHKQFADLVHVFLQ